LDRLKRGNFRLGAVKLSLGRGRLPRSSCMPDGVSCIPPETFRLWTASTLRTMLQPTGR
jgi:hypothetical protein